MTINECVNELESFNVKWFPKKSNHVNRYDFLLASVCMLGYPYNLYLLFNMFCINNMNILGCEKSLSGMIYALIDNIMHVDQSPT